jgi:ABC-type multidrug transport system fused ATPase/permease subunit
LIRTVEELRTEMGVLIVAHRLAAVRSADRIYVLQNGQVVESGTWTELVAKQGSFHALAESQPGGAARLTEVA